MKRFPISCLIVMICSAVFIGVIHCNGQGMITPYQKAILDTYYLNADGGIDGSLITTNSIPQDRLDFYIVTNEVDPVFVVFQDGPWTAHTVDSSAHHVKFANSDETDPVFTNWVATNSLAVRHVTNHFTFTSLDDVVILDAGTFITTSTVPTAVGAEGDLFRVKSMNTNDLVLTPFGSQLIDGETNAVLSYQGSANLISDNVGWYLFP